MHQIRQVSLQYKKGLLLRCIHHFDSDLINNMDHMLIDKIVWNWNFVGLLHHPFWLQLVLERLGHLFSTFEITSLAKDHWWGFSTQNAHMVHIVNKSDLKWCIHLSRSLFLYIRVINPHPWSWANQRRSKNLKWLPKSSKTGWSQKRWCNKPTKLQFQSILIRKILMLSKRYEST